MKGFYRGNMLGAHEMLEYSEKNGELWYEYRKSVEVPTKAHGHAYRGYTSSGEIPDDVFAKGEKEIEKYVRQKIARDLKRQQEKINTFEAFAKNPDFPVETEYDGTTLKGRIISAYDSTFRVRLEEPYQGEAHVIYGFGAGMAGKHIFAENGTKFSDDAVASAQKLLRQIYDKKKNYEEHKGVIDMAKRLNKENKD